MPIINIHEQKVHFQELNREGAETVLLVHGMLGNLAVYYFRIAPILARRFRVVMYDLKGHGMSERAACGYDLASMAEDLLALMDALGLRSVHLAGYSFGGLIALKAAILYPERIKRLSVIEGPDPSDVEPLEILNAYDKEAFAEYVSSRTNGNATRKGQRQMDKDNRMQEFLFTETTIREDMKRDSGFFYKGNIYGIRHKTLLIYGKESDCMAAGYALSYKINNSRLVLIEGDHSIPIREPVKIGKWLEQFFSK